METILTTVPVQHRIAEKETNISKTRTFDTSQQAEQLFLTAMQRLLDVNGWNSLAESESTRYRLMSKRGEPKSGAAEERDFIRVNHPLSRLGTKDSNWMLIDRIVSKLHNHKRSLSITLRPVDVKIYSSNLVCTFDNETNYILLVQLDETTVTAGVFEKNDLYTDGGANLHTRIWNAFKHVFPWADRSKKYWNSLAAGLLK